jgi:predicted PurR-regulated permease PerM
MTPLATTVRRPSPEVGRRVASPLLDVLIRAALIGAMAVLCYEVLAPFRALILWALILAVSIYPFQQALARRLGGRQAVAATIVVISGSVLILAPTVLLVNSVGHSLQDLVRAAQADTLDIPAPPAHVREWPIIGERIHDVWSQAHDDLPGLVKSMQPRIREFARASLAFVAGFGLSLLQFLASFIIAGILMVYGDAGARGARAIFERVIDRERGETFVKLSTATIRGVAKGVIGVAFIQAILVGLALLIANVPWAGVLAAITLVLGIAQVPALVVILPAVVYIWWSGHYGTGTAIAHTIVLLLSGMADNVLKPLMLGRGVDAPMPVILLGALGGLASGGILGMFVGATVLALGYQIFMSWVANNPATTASAAKKELDAPR